MWVPLWLLAADVYNCNPCKKVLNGGVYKFASFLCLTPSLSYLYFCFFPIGVPLSTQWGPQGYFYAIQIAQYGLSHYSKNLTERPPHMEVYDTVEERDSRSSTWTVPKGCSLIRVYDKTRATSVRQFSAPGKETDIELHVCNLFHWSSILMFFIHCILFFISVGFSVLQLHT